MNPTLFKLFAAILTAVLALALDPTGEPAEALAENRLGAFVRDTVDLIPPSILEEHEALRAALPG